MPPPKPKRQCANPDCKKSLSRYNPGRFCFACDSPHDVVKARKPRDSSLKKRG